MAKPQTIANKTLIHLWADGSWCYPSELSTTSKPVADSISMYVDADDIEHSAAETLILASEAMQEGLQLYFDSIED